ncbi:PEP-CTERM sorting domain-containing protein [bacterium]|nr:PEP-CTERM sorting domain-containing protein [bacterium]
MCVDSNGNIHIAYVSSDGSTKKIKYTNNIGGTFGNPVEIATTSWAYRKALIAVDSNDKVHIAYTGADDNGHRFIYYVNNIGGAFSTPTAVSPEGNYHNPAMALDSNGKAHIIWYRAGYEYTYYSNNIGDTFSSPIQIGWGDLKWPAIAIDSNDKAHVVGMRHSSATDSDVRYCNNVSGSFSSPSVISGTDPAADVAGCYWPIAIDSNNSVHVAFWSHYGDEDYEISYVNNMSGYFSTPTQITNNPDDHYRTSIVLDSNNNAHIAYYNGTSKDSYYTNNASGTFGPAEHIFSSHIDYPSMAIDKSTDDIYVVYGTGGEIYYATQAQEPIPEPATICLMVLGILGLVGVVIKQRRKGK